MISESNIAKRRLEKTAPIIDAMKLMDVNHIRMALVYDEARFLGILTIGDIQRAIIANPDMQRSVENILESGKCYATPENSVEEIKKLMLPIRAECMPVVNKEGNLEGLYEWQDLFDTAKEAVREKIDLPVVIMAGGAGTRLKPLTNVIPKPMIPIGEKTILEVILEQFESIGCRKFFMSVNYKAEILQYYLSTRERQYEVEYLKEDKPMGTIGSLSLLKGKIDKPFFVSNCDILIDQDYRDMYEYHERAGNEITIIGAIKHQRIPYGVVETGPDGIITALKEKPQTTYMVNTGVYLLNPSTIAEIPEGCFFHITDLIEKIRSYGGQVGCFPVSENAWTDIGDWEEYSKLVKNGCV